MNAICVFLGSRAGTDTMYLQAARAMGQAIARRNLTLVYGGSNTGLMKQLADAALHAGGRVTGVTVQSLKDKERFHPGLTRLHVVETMGERKRLMAQLSDGFVVLPGGIGTLEELFEILTLNLLGFHAKPCGILNINSYWDGMNAFLEHAHGQGFLKCDPGALILQSGTPDALLDQILQWQAPQVKADGHALP